MTAIRNYAQLINYVQILKLTSKAVFDLSDHPLEIKQSQTASSTGRHTVSKTYNRFGKCGRLTELREHSLQTFKQECRLMDALKVK